ncbi:MAG: formate dehydrogenase accessory protein FdhE, partial [Gemmatimonadaceae bacterium]
MLEDFALPAAGAADLLLAIAGATRQLAAALPDGVPNLAAARERLHNGVPALAGEALLDRATLLANAHELVRQLHALDAGLAQSAAHALLDLESAQLHGAPPDGLVEAALAATVDLLLPPLRALRPSPCDSRTSYERQHLRTNHLHSPTAFLAVLLDHAVRPALRAGAVAVQSVLADVRWSRGTCLACGSLPLLAELRGGDYERSRTLRCGRCACAWSYHRLACPTCGERDHRRLSYLHVDGESEHRRAECCKTCGFYLKAVAVLDP